MCVVSLRASDWQPLCILVESYWNIVGIFVRLALRLFVCFAQWSINFLNASEQIEAGDDDEGDDT